MKRKPHTEIGVLSTEIGVLRTEIGVLSLIMTVTGSCTGIFIITGIGSWRGIMIWIGTGFGRGISRHIAKMWLNVWFRGNDRLRRGS